VSELRSLLEVTLSKDRSAEEAREALDEALQVTLRAESLVVGLLSLARSPGGGSRMICDALHVAPVMRACLGRHRTGKIGPAGSVADIRLDEHACAVANQGGLEVVLENLVSNALEYASDPSRISLVTE
jgi:signal transduction histidine kinase